MMGDVKQEGGPPEVAGVNQVEVHALANDGLIPGDGGAYQFGSKFQY